MVPPFSRLTLFRLRIGKLRSVSSVVNSDERIRRTYEKDGHCCFVGVGGGGSGRVSAASALRCCDSRRHDRRWHGQSVVSGGHRNRRWSSSKDRDDSGFRACSESMSAKKGSF